MSILKQHPDYQSRWATKLSDLALSTDEQNEYLFMLATRWPDDIKEKNNSYNHSAWHYMDFIHMPDKGIAHTDSSLDTRENILLAYAWNQAIFRSNVPNPEKSVALC